MPLNKLKVNAEEESIRLAIRELPDEIRAQVFAEVGTGLRDPDTYALLNWTLMAGLHHLYLGKYFRFISELGGFLLGLYMIFRGGTEVDGHVLMFLGIAIIAVLVVVEWVELFRAQIVVQDFNNRASRDILRKYQAQ